MFPHSFLHSALTLLSVWKVSPGPIAADCGKNYTAKLKIGIQIILSEDKVLMICVSTISTNSPRADHLIGRWATFGDRADASRRRTSSTQHCSLLARGLLRAILFQFTSQKDWLLRANDHGKLFSETKAGAAGPYICLAHTVGMVACAVGNIGPIGVDVEQHTVRNFQNIAKYAFGPTERALVDKGGAAEFYRIWTLREAMGKATGQGLELVTDRIDRALNDSNEMCWISLCGGSHWLLIHLYPQPGFSLAAAVDVTKNNDEVKESFTLIDAEALS